MFAVLGSKPNLSVHLDTLKWYTETKSMALIYVEEKLHNGMLILIEYRYFLLRKINNAFCLNLGGAKRISNNDIVNYLMQAAPKQQLSTMGVENIFPYTGFTEENLREYFENPPAGMKILTFYLIVYIIVNF